MKSISLKYFLRNQLESPCPKFNEKSYVYLTADFFELNNQNINEYIENANEEITLFATKLTDSDFINIDGYI